MDTSQLIQQQKAIADEVLEKLEIIDPNAVLAGGAPTDWFYGKPCRDLDFYLWVPPQETNEKYIARLNRLGFNVNPVQGPNNPNLSIEDITGISEMYSGMTNLKSVFESNVGGITLQFMRMFNLFSSGQNLVQEFGTTTCMAWYKRGDIYTNKAFNFSHDNKIIYHRKDVTCSNKHLLKQQQKFPGYKVKPIEKLKTDYAESILVDTELMSFS